MRFVASASACGSHSSRRTIFALSVNPCGAFHTLRIRCIRCCNAHAAHPCFYSTGTTMNWAISNLTGGNRVSRAILVRYSAVPLASDAADSLPQTPSSSGAASVNVSTATFPGSSFLHASSSTSRQHVPGRAVPQQQRNGATATQLSLPLDVEETVTCFCR